jgi:hypothetical protein
MSSVLALRGLLGRQQADTGPIWWSLELELVAYGAPEDPGIAIMLILIGIAIVAFPLLLSFWCLVFWSAERCLLIPVAK